MLLKHLHSRNLNTELHPTWLDNEEYCATFPLWNLSGQLVGYQNYRPNASKVKKNDLKGKYYTFRNKNEVGVWGLESWYMSRTLFLTESVFNAARLTSLGYSATGLLSNNPNEPTKSWLWTVKQSRHVVSVCDPGKGGELMMHLGNEYVVVDVDVENEVDLADAPLEWVQTMADFYN